MDLLVERGGELRAVEIKSGVTFQKDFIKSVRYFCKLSKSEKGYLVYNGEQEGSYSDIDLVPIKKIDSILS